MIIYKDLDLVEHLGSGVPRILEHYGTECFKFSDNFLRMTFPSTGPVAPQVTPQVTPQVSSLLAHLKGEMDRKELQEKLGLSDRKNFSENYLKPALEAEVIEMTIPDKPTSSKQRYRITALGQKVLSTQ